MFTKKVCTDLKKSTLKIQDCKKDSLARLKHLKMILELVDMQEAKSIFEKNYSHIYFVLHDSFVQSEFNFKHKAYRDHREELEGFLWLLKHIICLLPELLSQRWQCHSLSRIMKKLLYLGNSSWMRKEGVRHFIMWYQVLADNAPKYVHELFDSITPNLIMFQKKMKVISDKKFERHDHTVPKLEAKAPISHEIGSYPVKCLETIGLIPLSAIDWTGLLAPKEELSIFLNCLVQSSGCIKWKSNSSQRESNSITFLLNRLKEIFVPAFCPDFDITEKVYEPRLLPFSKQFENKDYEVVSSCVVVLIKWISRFINEENTNSKEDKEFVQHAESIFQTWDKKCSMNLRERLLRDSLYSTQSNINFIHEVFRQGFLLNLNSKSETEAVRISIAVYKNWITKKNSRLFLFVTDETEDTHVSTDLTMRSIKTESNPNVSANNRDTSRHVHAGLQHLIKIFVTNTANVFLIKEINCNSDVLISNRDYMSFSGQADVCKKILNVYRSIVMNIKMEPKTWEKILLVLLHIISNLFSTHSNSSMEQLTCYLDKAIFQTLIVTWIRAHTYVPINVQLWDRLLNLLSTLTTNDALINEWEKTMQTMTRVLARYVYNLNLQDLPLDRLVDNKSKRRRIADAWQTPLHVRTSRSSQILHENAHETRGVKTEKSNLEWTATAVGVKLTKCRCYSYESFFISTKKTNTNSLNEANGLDSSISFDYLLNVLHEQSNASSSLEKIDLRAEDFPPKIKIRRRAKSLISFQSLEIRKKNSIQEFRTTSPTAQKISMPLGSLKSTPIAANPICNDLECDNTSITSSENRSIILGGYVSGWLPVTAAIMWKRMLASLGDINLVTRPEIHSRLYENLVEIAVSLVKIKLNQGVSGDNANTLIIPSYVPPIGILSPWCFGAHLLGPEFKRGKLSATKILCLIGLHGSVHGKTFVSLFHNFAHRVLNSQELKLIACLLKSIGGVRFLTQMLPGQTLLFLDIISASSALLASYDSNSDVSHGDIISLLGSLQCYPLLAVPTNVLGPSSGIKLLESFDLQDLPLNIILLYARRGTSSKARCIAFAKLSQWVYLELTRLNKIKSEDQINYLKENGHLETLKSRIEEAIKLLLKAIYFKHPTLATVAAGSLKMLRERSDELLQINNLTVIIITELCTALERKYVLTVTNADKVPLSTIIMGLGEFCMSLPANILFCQTEGKIGCDLMTMVLRSLFYVLSSQKENNYQKSVPDDDFVENICFDDVLGNKFNDECNLQKNKNSIRLCAKSVVMHLVNNIDLFPKAIGASRCNSLIEENDDVPIALNTADDPEQFRTHVNNEEFKRFLSPSTQLFILKPRILGSFKEIPVMKNNSSIPFSLPVTVSKQVRVLLRDLNGKYCWETSALYSKNRKSYHNVKSFLNHTQRNTTHIENIFYAITPFDVDFLTLSRPTMRRRKNNELPVATELASDLDQLGDLLQYIGFTCSECLLNSFSPNMPAKSTLGSQLEAQIISKLARQRTIEQNIEKHVTGSGKEKERNIVHPSKNTSTIKLKYRFQLGRTFISHLGFTGWETRYRVHLLKDSEKLTREIRNIDNQKCRDTHKVAIVYVASGQEDKNSILKNTCGSSGYESFVSALGWEIDLETHNGFLGGLSRQGCGSTAPYYATPFVEVIYHAATRMPSDSSDALLTKTRHLGNDEVHIVWSEHYREYRRDILPTEFCDVLIVVYPLENCLFRVTVTWKPDVPWFGPLAHESIVNGSCLAVLVRETAINASRSKRSSLPLYQQYYEERSQSLENICLFYKENSTFEDFTRRVYINSCEKQFE